MYHLANLKKMLRAERSNEPGLSQIGLFPFGSLVGDMVIRSLFYGSRFANLLRGLDSG